MNFTFDTIAPVRELVIVVPDLYLSRELHGSAGAAPAFANLPGIEQLARFGERARLPRGWREALLPRTARTDLEGVAPACVAAAAVEMSCPASPPTLPPGAHSACWIATPLHLRAGLQRLHLDPGGLLRLPAAEQAQLSAGFARSFAASGYVLAPLSSGDFLLLTPDIAPLATSEPARCAGRDLSALMPSATAPAPLRRLLTEMEMWLHTDPVNAQRLQRDAPAVTSLWPWGASGRIVRPAPGRAVALPLAWGRDAWLEGLWRLQGSMVRPTPQRFEEVLGAGSHTGVLVVEMAAEMHDRQDQQQSLAAALRRIDAAVVSPAFEALRGGALDDLSLMVNDFSVHARRRGLRRFWRRAPSGLAGYV